MSKESGQKRVLNSFDSEIFKNLKPFGDNWEDKIRDIRQKRVFGLQNCNRQRPRFESRMSSDDDKIEAEIARYAHLYRVNRPGWHQNEVNPILLRSMSMLTKSSTDNFGCVDLPCKTIFPPLCGKSKDIPYLLGLGFKVFGVEAARDAIEQLNAENSLDVRFSEEESIYHTPDKSLIIYLGDIFKCPVEKWAPFDCVWDRGSISIFPEEQRQHYVQVIWRGLGADFRYLLEVYVYDKTLHNIPPRAFSRQDVDALFGSWANVQMLENIPVSERFLSHFKHLIGTNCSQVVYLFSNL